MFHIGGNLTSWLIYLLPIVSLILISRVRYKSACASSDDSDKSACPHRSVSFRLKKPGPLAAHRAHIKDSDQTAQTKIL